MPLDGSNLRFPLSDGAPEELKLDIRISPIHGRPVIHFPYMFMSDWHLGSRFAKAMMLRRTLRDCECDRLTLGGDIIGGIELMHKKTHTMAAGHIQAQAQVLQKAERTRIVYLAGNHEMGIETLLAKPRSLFGVECRQTSEFTDTSGRRMLEEHGHAHDLQLFGNVTNQRLGYIFGTSLLYAGSNIDYVMHEKLGLQEWSTVNWGKRRWKEFANKELGLLKIIDAAIDCSDYAGSISGHSHILGFHRTPHRKLQCNAGSSATKGSEFIAYDGRNFAAVERLRDRLNIEMESGHKYTVDLRKAGLDHCSDPPADMDNIHVARAEQLQSLNYALFPAQDQKEIRRQLHERRCAVDRMMCILSQAGSQSGYAEMQRALLQASREAGDLREQRGVNPYPPIRDGMLGLARHGQLRGHQLSVS